MAATKTYFAKSNYLGQTNGFVGSDSVFELNESDVWNVTDSSELGNSVPSSRITNRCSPTAVKREQTGGTPVSVPDRSNIVNEDYRKNRRYGGDDGYDWIPPHEFLARRRMASFSVHEGIGRTLKGRDLSRVRNAIWEKTGFED